MAGNRRLNPAELKARLQANLAVAGVKSSDPRPVAVADPGEKPQITPEALGNAPELPSEVQAPNSHKEAQRASPRDSETPASHRNHPFEDAKPSALAHSDAKAEPAVAMSATASGPHPEISVAENSHKTMSESSHLGSSMQPLQVKNPRTIAEPTTLHSKQNVGSILSTQPSEAKGPAPQSSPDQHFAAALGGPGGRNSDGIAGANQQNETAKTAARTAESRAESASTQAVTPARKRALATPPTVAKRADRTVLHRRDQGAVLRGYRIPVDLHRQAERAKLGLASRRGSSLFWDELLQGAIDLLLDDTHRISAELRAARRTPEMGTTSSRVLQAAIRHDQDLRLRMLRIDLEELDGATVRLEEIWTWLIRQVVKNEG
jgi:hypothetical protein